MEGAGKIAHLPKRPIGFLLDTPNSMGGVLPILEPRLVLGAFLPRVPVFRGHLFRTVGPLLKGTLTVCRNNTFFGCFRKHHLGGSS